MPGQYRPNKTIRRCRYPGCGSEGHDRRKCAMMFREEEERASGRQIPPYLADNNNELRRIRTMTATRRREEREALRAAAEAQFPVLPGAALEGNALQRREQEVQAAQALLDQAAPAQALRNQAFPPVERWRANLGLHNEYQLGLQNEVNGGIVSLVSDEEGLARMAALPVLRETAVEATECPICIEDLGEVGKTVLKCGHTLCVSCFLQQMMRATAESRARDCKCPVCRVSYIM